MFIARPPFKFIWRRFFLMIPLITRAAFLWGEELILLDLVLPQKPREDVFLPAEYEDPAQRWLVPTLRYRRVYPLAISFPPAHTGQITGESHSELIFPAPPSIPAEWLLGPAESGIRDSDTDTLRKPSRRG